MEETEAEIAAWSAVSLPLTPPAGGALGSILCGPLVVIVRSVNYDPCYLFLFLPPHFLVGLHAVSTHAEYRWPHYYATFVGDPKYPVCRSLKSSRSAMTSCQVDEGLPGVPWLLLMSLC